MARIRSIKPEFWADAKLARCSRDARLTFVGLLNESDDQGRQRYSAMRLTGTLFEHDGISAKRLSGWVAELEREGIVHFYEGGDGILLCIPNLRKHQVISKPAKSRLDPCPTHGQQAPDPGETPGQDRKSPGTVLGVRSLEVGAGEPGTGEQGNGAARRRADPAWDALVEVCSINSEELSDEARNKLNGMVKGLVSRMHGLSRSELGEEIRRRAENYRDTHGLALTPERLVGRWAELSESRPPRPLSEMSGSGSPTDRLLRKVQEVKRGRDEGGRAGRDSVGELPG